MSSRSCAPPGLSTLPSKSNPTKGQIDDLLAEIQKRGEVHERVLVTTLTKRMAEDLADYLAEMGLKVHYLHSEVDTLERIEILSDLRRGVYDVVVGINLLREGLDLPEVSLVAILDADKEGFLRSEVSLIQTVGRAARHINGHVIMYADRVTNSMKNAIDETYRRRSIQVAYNPRPRHHRQERAEIPPRHPRDAPRTRHFRRRRRTGLRTRLRPPQRAHSTRDVHTRKGT